MLVARSTNSQVGTYTKLMRNILIMNHAGICVSYVTTWKYLKQLTDQARYTELVREGHWLWVFDNVNMHQKVRHEREGNVLKFSISKLYLQQIATRVCSTLQHA